MARHQIVCLVVLQTFCMSVQVDIVTAGDQVNELHLIVAGQAVVERLASADVITDGLLLVVDGAGHSSDAAQPVVFGPEDSAGEMAFFTEMPCLEVRVGWTGAGCRRDCLAHVQGQEPCTVVPNIPTAGCYLACTPGCRALADGH